MSAANQCPAVVWVAEFNPNVFEGEFGVLAICASKPLAATIMAKHRAHAAKTYGVQSWQEWRVRRVRVRGLARAA